MLVFCKQHQSLKQSNIRDKTYEKKEYLSQNKQLSTDLGT